VRVCFLLLLLAFGCDVRDSQDQPLSQVSKKGPLSRDTSKIGIIQGTAKEFVSAHLGNSIIVPPGVFGPFEAEELVLPLMKENAQRFAGSTVLEIGTGSGIISLYAAKVGARKVVSTDISEDAIRAAAANAKGLGFDAVIEQRLVPPSDMSAYSVIGPDESFDIIISNPPYSLDLDAEGNNAVTDRGDLGLSIIRGLEKHLRPQGAVILLYKSIFYHQVMVKFARYRGYEVRSHVPEILTPWEAETLFNSYLERLLEYQGVDRNVFRFDMDTDEGLNLQRPKLDRKRGTTPLFPGNSATQYQGMMVIERRN